MIASQIRALLRAPEAPLQGWGTPLSRTRALLVSITIAILFGYRTFAHEKAVGNTGGDFAGYALAAKTLLDGGNPYDLGVLLYPLPSILVVVPLSPLHPVAGAAVFAGFGVFLLTLGLLRRFGWPGLVMLLSPSFFLGWYYLQWSPLIVAGALLPWLGGFGVTKPNLMLATVAYRPSWQLLVGSALLAAASFSLVPTWVSDWFHDVALQTAPHTSPVRWPLGLVGLLGLIQWRLPEGRALVAMTLSPLNPQYYDHLGVWLSAMTWRDSLILSVCGWVGFLTFVATAPHDLTKDATPAHLSLAFGVYLPATLLLLRHRLLAWWAGRGLPAHDV